MRAPETAARFLVQRLASAERAGELEDSARPPGRLRRGLERGLARVVEAERARTRLHVVEHPMPGALNQTPIVFHLFSFSLISTFAPSASRHCEGIHGEC